MIYFAASPVKSQIGTSRSSLTDDVSNALTSFEEKLSQFTGGDELKEFRRLVNQRINEMRNNKLGSPTHWKALRIIGIIEGGRTVLKLFVSDPRFPSNEQIFGERIARFIDANDLSILSDEEKQRAQERAFNDYLATLTIEASNAGFVVLEPVWLVDPKA